MEKPTYEELLSSYQNYQKLVRESANCGCFACPDGDWTDPMTPLKVHHCPLHEATSESYSEALVRANEQYGHNMESDPPHPLSKALRYTCSKCGHAILWSYGNVYGTALDTPCKEAANLSSANVRSEIEESLSASLQYHARCLL